jgi:hypothetical protein
VHTHTHRNQAVTSSLSASYRQIKDPKSKKQKTENCFRSIFDKPSHARYLIIYTNKKSVSCKIRFSFWRSSGTFFVIFFSNPLYNAAMNSDIGTLDYIPAHYRHIMGLMKKRLTNGIVCSISLPFAMMAKEGITETNKGSMVLSCQKHILDVQDGFKCLLKGFQSIQEESKLLQTYFLSFQNVMKHAQNCFLRLQKMACSSGNYLLSVQNVQKSTQNYFLSLQNVQKSTRKHFLSLQNLQRSTRKHFLSVQNVQRSTRSPFLSTQKALFTEYCPLTIDICSSNTKPIDEKNTMIMVYTELLNKLLTLTLFFSVEV